MAKPNCSKGACPNPPAPDSVMCDYHRDMTRATNQRFAEKTKASSTGNTEPQKDEKPKIKYTRKKSVEKADVRSLPSPREKGRSVLENAVAVLLVEQARTEQLIEGLRRAIERWA